MNTNSNVNTKRHLNKSTLLNEAGISVFVRNFKAVFTNFGWQKYEDRVSDNSPFVTGDSFSSNDIHRMKKQKIRQCKQYNNRPFKHKLVQE